MVTTTNPTREAESADRQLTYFRRTRWVTWILAVLLALGAAAGGNGSTSTESLETFGYTLAVILFIWGLDSHVRIRRVR